MRLDRARAACLALVPVVFAVGSAVTARQAAQPSVPSPVGTRTELGLAGFAKVLCSAVFISEREPEEAARNSAYWFMPRDEQDKVQWKLDREQKLARASFGTTTREARFYGDQGCIIQTPGKPGIHFKPVPVTTTLPDAASQPWPMGDRPDKTPMPPGIDKAKLDTAVDAAFADPAALTAAFLVLYKNRIVAERYLPGITKDTQLESWSMGKSITSTLFGLLVKDGTYTLEQPAPVALWQSPNDERSKIRNVDLLRMSAGLRFLAEQDPDYSPDKGYPDHFYIYTGAVDAFEYSINRPLQFPPNTEGRYRNCDPLTIGYLIKQAVQKRGQEYLTWPQRALFDRIGIRRQVLETDPYGNFLLSGYDYGTARNWARIGLLYLQNGKTQGSQLLPEDWARFVSTPAPAWKRNNYGGFFWVNGDGRWNLPRDAYYAAGAGGQNTWIVPSHDLVIVRMGHMRGSAAAVKPTNAALEMIIEAASPAGRPSQAPGR
jgi:CubicO group peptidase (beta-lactamase class C family)